MSKKLKNIVHILFVLGIIITIIGWFFDRAKSFNWLMSAIAPDYISAKQALNGLKNDEKIGITSHHEGFRILVDKWPKLNNKEAVKFIGRSKAFIAFASEIKNDIELIAYDKDMNEIKERWKISEASYAVENMIETKFLSIGGILFWIGIFISTASHIVGSMAN